MNKEPDRQMKDGPSILVVEDEDLLRWTIRRKLEDAGFNVLDAASVQGALDAAARTKIDILVSDYRLEDGFGDELAGLIAGRSPIELVLMSGEIEQVEFREAPGVSLIRKIRKPVDLAGLVDLLKDGRAVSGIQKERSQIGSFRLVRASSMAELEAVNSLEDEDIAVVLDDAFSCEDTGLLRSVLLRTVRPGRRLCVVSRNSAVSIACREAGIDNASDETELEVVSRRLVSESERSAVMSITMERG